ncbi:hypothetical protein H9W90_13810 [Polaribacter pectinis]|uniref:Outer membrane protein beta-barrel domain-containing protein n=1 Tax=Polaribacter pectinis TaxID=2738844 RepID=A0A7G9L9F2_9FLAO|nr:hypothetical protein [Polaribacter pectinis]QNM85251.1 hypothetical protein H9W90_13810 [Polaribacter pectinis]
MKKLLLLIIFFSTIQTSFSQEKLGRPFFTGDVNLTLGINENYQIGPNDDGGPLIVPSALFFRIGFGYEFKKRLAVSLNGGYDFHFNYDVDAFPTYGALKYNITEKDDSNHFVEFRYGKMWTPSSRYPDGNYYGIGLGIQVAGEKRWNTIFRVDFHRKGITGFKNNRLDSVSFGFGFSFF